jgi:hypothetical protein
MAATAKPIVLLSLLIYLPFCALVDFVPHFGPPNFRYNGSDPGKYVWNFGMPFSLSIYDPQSGWHDGPGMLMIHAQLLALGGVVVAIVAITRELTRKLLLGLLISYVSFCALVDFALYSDSVPIIIYAQLFVLGIAIAIVAITRAFRALKTRAAISDDLSSDGA